LSEKFAVLVIDGRLILNYILITASENMGMRFFVSEAWHGPLGNVKGKTFVD
jgi:hypothetical protein